MSQVCLIVLDLSKKEILKNLIETGAKKVIIFGKKEEDIFNGSDFRDFDTEITFKEMNYGNFCDAAKEIYFFIKSLEHEGFEVKIAISKEYEKGLLLYIASSIADVEIVNNEISIFPYVIPEENEKFVLNLISSHTYTTKDIFKTIRYMKKTKDLYVNLYETPYNPASVYRQLLRILKRLEINGLVRKTEKDGEYEWKLTKKGGLIGCV